MLREVLVRRSALPGDAAVIAMASPHRGLEVPFREKLAERESSILALSPSARPRLRRPVPPSSRAAVAPEAPVLVLVVPSGSEVGTVTTNGVAAPPRDVHCPPRELPPRSRSHRRRGPP